MPIAYSYVRFSTKEQQKGDSLRRQRSITEAYALKHNLTLDTSLNLNDLGISAYDKSNIERGALGEFLNLVRSGKIPKSSYLLVENLDRLSRANVMDALTIFMDILRGGIKIVTLQDEMTYDYETLNEGNWGGLVASIAFMSRASEESATKSKRGRSLWENKREKIREKRLTEQCPAWMKPSDEKTGFILIPERVEIIKRIFQMANDGAGNTLIIRRLNQEKTPTFTNKTKNRISTGWYDSYIQKIFKSTAIYGEFQPCIHRDKKSIPIGNPIENYYPAIMTKSEWEQINNIRMIRKTRGGVHKGDNLSNLFSGLLKCGYCGGTMTMGGRTKKIKSKNITVKNRYVACNNARRGIGCIYRQWEYSELEDQLLKICKSLDFASLISKNEQHKIKLTNISQEIFKLNDELSTKKAKLEKLFELVEDNKEITSKFLKERIRDSETSIVNLEEIIINLEKHRVELEININASNDPHKTIIELIEQVNTLTGSDLQSLRLKISSIFKRHISEIKLFPLGRKATTAADENHKSPENKTIFITFKNGNYTYYQNDYIQEITQGKFDELKSMYAHLNPEWYLGDEAPS